jgi:hypothetical protein
MRDGYQHKTERYLYPVKHHAATVMGVLSTPTCPLERVALRTMYHTLVIQMVQLYRKRYTEDVMIMQQSTRVVDSSMCIEHIINPV